MIEITKHVEYCSSYEDGGVICSLIDELFQKNENVEVDFDGVLSITTAFANAAFVHLLDKYPIEFIQSHLNFRGTTRQINKIIKDRFQFVAQSKNCLNHNLDC